MLIICPGCGKEIAADANFCPFCAQKIREPISDSLLEPAPVSIPTKESAHYSCAWCGKDAEIRTNQGWACDACYEEIFGKPGLDDHDGPEWPWASIIEVSSVIFLIIAVFAGAGIGSLVEEMSLGEADGAAFLGGLIGFTIGVVSVAQSMAIAKILRKVTSLTDKFKDK